MRMRRCHGVGKQSRANIYNRSSAVFIRCLMDSSASSKRIPIAGLYPMRPSLYASCEWGY